MRLQTRLLAVVFALTAPAGSFADIITLSDGSKITGTLTRQGDSMLITAEGGKVTTVRAAEVAGVTLTSTVSPEERAEMEWKNLQPALKRAAKIEDVLSLLQKFDDLHHGKPAGDKAVLMLENFKQLQTQDPVKFRGEWIPKEKVDAVVREDADRAKPILDSYKQNKLKETVDLAKAQLKTNSDNPGVLLAAGLAAYRLNQPQAARDYFSHLVEVKEDSVIGLNNLAVLHFELNHPIEGMLSFTQALRQAPDNRLVIDNACEALARSEKLKSAQNYIALDRVFQQSEARAAAAMAKEGMVRRGSSWVKQEQVNIEEDTRKTLDQKLADAKRVALEADMQVRAAQQEVAVARVSLRSSQQQFNTGDDTVNSVEVSQQNLQTSQNHLVIVTKLAAAAREDLVRIQIERDKSQAPPPSRVLQIMELTDIADP